MQKVCLNGVTNCLRYVILFTTISLWVHHVTAQRKSLTTLTPVFAYQKTGDVTIIKPSNGNPNLRLGTHKFSSGLKTNVNSQITYVFDSGYRQLDAWIGLALNHNGASKDNNSTIIFQIFGDGNKIYDSGILDTKSPAKHLDVDVSGVKELTLFVRSASTVSDPGHLTAIWGDPLLLPVKSIKKTDKKPVYEIKGGNHTSIKLDRNGDVVAINRDKRGGYLPLQGKTRLAQCQEVKLIRVRSLKGGGMAFTHLFSDKSKRQFFVTDKFTPTKHSIRWDVDVYSTGEPWSTAIITSIKWPVSEGTGFWTSWSRSDMSQWHLKNKRILINKWKDPLVTQPFTNSARWYGSDPFQRIPTLGRNFSIPIATVIDPLDSYGFSLVQSPKDTVFYMKLVTTRNGVIEFQRYYNRIGGGRHTRFSMDFVNHAKCWRSGLKWIVDRYPSYFNPVNPLAHKLSGSGAYSSWKGKLDTAMLNKMAFKFNWEASFDFPYMGMFMPPVDSWHALADPTESTKNTNPSNGSYKGMSMSRKKLADYCSMMREYGYYVLNYFNVTEFGMDIKRPGYREKITVGKDNLWKNSNDFLHDSIADGILYNQDGDYYRSWGGAVVMDAGGKNYQDFLIGQAKDIIKYQPSSAGICIDRLDWLRFFNTHADDGISWYHNAPARSLYSSWNSLMARLGPLMHENRKVIFVNPITSMRLDIMRRVDGIYWELHDLMPELNACAFLGLRMPVIAWTHSASYVQPHPDIYFQRLLYLGIFPTAPIPYNNHAILPGKLTNEWYLEYGPLFKSMEGRKWVLLPHVVTVPENNAKANIFKVPDGYVVPVVLAENGTLKAKVMISSQLFSSSPLADFSIEVIQPGTKNPISIKPIRDNVNNVILNVPLKQGCALVRFQNK